MIRILLVDDKASIREEMRRLLELEEDIQVIGEAADGWEAIERTRTLHPDLILMDKAMPSLDGIQATRLIKKDHPWARIIFLAAEDAWRQEALQAGAEAYLLKDHGADAVVGTIKKAMESRPGERIERGFRLRGWLIEGCRRLWTQSPVLTMGLLILLLLTLSDVALFILLPSALELVVRMLTNYSLAAISLLFGIFFLAYAAKYYTSIGLILFSNHSNNNGMNHAHANGYGEDLDYEPFVSIHLPLYNEERVVDRLLTACTSFDYENYEVIVADDSTDGTTEILERWANHPRVKITHREDRSGFKGGALQAALKHMDPRIEFVMIFDADFIPPPDIIRQFLAYFNRNGYLHNGNHHDHNHDHDPYNGNLAVVQGYQRHILNASENWITRAVRAEFSASFMVDRPGQELYGGMKMISGSVYMIRADVLRKMGWGTSITEDWELTLRLYSDGYKVLYTPYVQAPAECVADFLQLVRQRMRWAEGHTFNVKKYFSRVLTSPHISLQEKIDFLFYTPYYMQAFFFMVGTTCWVLGQMLHQRLPFWPASLGWSLVVVNTLATTLVALSALYIEGGARKSIPGLASLWALSFLLAPFYGYAALKGLLEKDEGGWHRTAKSGRITEILGKLLIRKKLRRLLPPRRSRYLAAGRPAGPCTPASACSEKAFAPEKAQADPHQPEVPEYQITPHRLTSEVRRASATAVMAMLGLTLFLVLL